MPVSLKRDKDNDEVIAADDSNPYYWGARIHLEGAVLKKLKLPEVGDEVIVVAKAFVASKEKHESTGSKNESASIQLTEIDVRPAADKRANDLYGESDE